MPEDSQTHEGRGCASQPRSNGTQSIRRSFQLLDRIAAAGALGISLTELSRDAGLAAPTIHRMLKALADVGAVEQNLRTRKYFIGQRLGALAAERPQRLRLIDLVNPFLAQASRDIAPVVWLSHRANLDAACDARVARDFVKGPFVPVGSRRPLGMPAASLAMLLEFDDDEADALLRQNHDRLSKLSVSPSEAGRELRDARRRKFALRERGRITGLTTVSLAIKPFQTRCLAALTVGQAPQLATPQWIDRAVRFLHDSRDKLNRVSC